MLASRCRSLFCVLFSGLAVACSTGGSGSDGTSVAPLTLAVTDAASDDLASFVVPITAFELVRPGGAVVGVLPDPVSLDLVTLEDVSEILNIVNVPLGLYTAANVTFDFGAAEAFLSGETTPATIVDGDGVALTGTTTLPISIGGLLTIFGNRNKILELDFDLNQSLMVDTGTNTVFVEPAIVLRVDRNDPKDLRAGGVIQSVDEVAGTMSVQLQTLTGNPVADVLVAVDGSTVYQIDGVPAQGATGLTALANLPAGTWIQCYGAVDFLAARLDAVYVEAGTGTYNGGQDIIEGHVVGRVAGGNGPILTVLGHSNDAAHTSFLFNTSFTVSTDATNTKIVRRGFPQAFDADDINIGQRVRLFGTLNGFTLDATAADSVVRLQPTRLLGFSAGAPGATELTFDLERVDLRDEGTFTWSEGGTTPVDPDAVVAEVGGLATGLGITAGTPLVVQGFFSAIDDDDADFVATSLVNRSLAPSLVLVHDRSGGLSVTPTVSSTEISLSIAGTPDAGEFALLDQGFVGAVALPTTPDPKVVPSGAFGFYTIRDRRTGSVSLHLTFAAFTTTLDALLAQGAVLYNLSAIGTYDTPSNTVASGLVGVTVD